MSAETELSEALMQLVERRQRLERFWKSVRDGTAKESFRLAKKLKPRPEAPGAVRA